MSKPRFIVYELDEEENSDITHFGNEEIIKYLTDKKTYVIVDKKNQVLITLLGSNASPKMKTFASVFTVDFHRRHYSKYQTTTFDSINEFKQYVYGYSDLKLTKAELRKYEQKIRSRFFKGGSQK